MSVVSDIKPIKEHIMTEDHVEERKPLIYGPGIENLVLESVSNPRTETDFANLRNSTEDNNENAAERGTRVNNVQYNEKRESSVQNTEPMDWTPTKSEATLPSPRSRSRSGSESPTTASRTVAVNLIPLSDSIVFGPKHLMFAPDQEIKVGRVSGSRNQKEAKAENGVFSCDVMSREHALLKESNGKIMIKDTKSTHGTFVNNVRLGDSKIDSEWKELKHGDVITFGHSVKRNQNLYKHLSAYVYYPKEKKELPPIPISPNDAQSSEFSNDLTKIVTNKLEKKEGQVSEYIANDPSTDVSKEGFSSAAPVSSKVEKPIEIQKEHKSTKIDETWSTSSAVSGQKNLSNIRETRQTSEVETTASVVSMTIPGNSTTSVKQKAQIATVKQERRVVTSDRNVSRFDVPVVKDEVIPTDDFRKVTEDHKSITSASTSDPIPFEETTLNPVTIPRNTTVSYKEKTSTQVYRETKHPKTSRKDNDVSEDKINNENAVNNGEGPSHVTETTNIVSTVSRKRKFEETEEEGLQQVHELKEKIADLEKRANKRRRWELIASTVVGMAAGVVSIGVGAYMLGN